MTEIRPELALMPSGNAEGLPVLRVVDDEAQTPSELVRSWEPYWAPNCWGVLFDRWTWCDRTAEILERLRGSDEWATRHLACLFDADNPASALPHTTLVADASSLCERAKDNDELLAAIAKLHPLHAVTDLVMRTPMEVDAPVLERLSAAIDPQAGGMLYVPADAPWLASMRATLFHVRTPWAMRERAWSPR